MTPAMATHGPLVLPPETQMDKSMQISEMSEPTTGLLVLMMQRTQRPIIYSTML
jgi:hypothetical protein